MGTGAPRGAVPEGREREQGRGGAGVGHADEAVYDGAGAACAGGELRQVGGGRAHLLQVRLVRRGTARYAFL